jgi:hypothetical protein
MRDSFCGKLKGRDEVSPAAGEQLGWVEDFEAVTVNLVSDGRHEGAEIVALNK